MVRRSRQWHPSACRRHRCHGTRRLDPLRRRPPARRAPSRRAHPLDAHDYDALEARHLFHHRHRTRYLTGIVCAAIALTTLLPQLDTAAIRLYLIEGALLVAWFLILHATRLAHRLPKELAVGLFFAAAIFIPTVARHPDLRLALLPGAILFGVLCSLNCLFIYAWEHEHPHPLREIPPHPTTRFALRHITALTLAEIAAALTLALLYPAGLSVIPAACALAAALLLILDRTRRQLGRTTLRAAADLALLTPLLLLVFPK